MSIRSLTDLPRAQFLRVAPAPVVTQQLGLGQGRTVQGTHRPRDASSKGRIAKGTHRPRTFDRIRTHYYSIILNDLTKKDNFFSN